ncbi:hypothetical protein JHW43_003008 [Diplocarpon mali]|nr:hypothetical protein JHW43_003008 [Diplocarpon mali]
MLQNDPEWKLRWIVFTDREKTIGPLDMEYFRTLHVNGFDREPEPSDTNKVAAKYRKAYENMFSCSTTPESDTATTTPDIPAAERTRALAICTMVGAIRGEA